MIVTGDLFILGVQCENIGMFYLTGALTSFVFSLLIYSLAISFGDVGKAVVVVVMVLQIAGVGYVPDRAAAAGLPQNLSLLPLSLCHRRSARVPVRHVRQYMARADRVSDALRRGRAHHRPVCAKAVYRPERVRRGEAGGVGAVLRGGAYFAE